MAEDPFADLRALVDREVVALVDWYDGHADWPRRLHLAAQSVIVVLGASIPVVSVASAATAARITVAALGALVTVVAGLSATFAWGRRWRLFRTTQNTLNELLADWRLELTLAADRPAPDGRTRAVAATTALLAAARQARRSETAEFFRSTTEEKSVRAD